MASDQGFAEFVADQLSGPCTVTFKKMFGEYGLYADGTFIGVICDNQLFIKPTEGGRQFIGDPVEAPPYPGAKLSFLIEGQIEDPEWVGELVRITARELEGSKGRAKSKKGSHSSSDGDQG